MPSSTHRKPMLQLVNKKDLTSRARVRVRHARGKLRYEKWLRGENFAPSLRAIKPGGPITTDKTICLARNPKTTNRVEINAFPRRQLQPLLFLKPIER
jgi:hypothetical protein